MNKRKYFTECLCASIFDEKVYHYDGYYVDGGITLECNLSDLKEDFKMDGRYDNIKEYAINELDFKDVKDVIDDVILQGFLYMYGENKDKIVPYIDEIFEDENCINKLLSDFLISSGDGSVCDACVDYIKKMPMERKVSIVNKLL